MVMSKVLTKTRTAHGLPLKALDRSNAALMRRKQLAYLAHVTRHACQDTSALSLGIILALAKTNTVPTAVQLINFLQTDLRLKAIFEKDFAFKASDDEFCLYQVKTFRRILPELLYQMPDELLNATRLENLTITLIDELLVAFQSNLNNSYDDLFRLLLESHQFPMIVKDCSRLVCDYFLDSIS